MLTAVVLGALAAAGAFLLVQAKAHRQVQVTTRAGRERVTRLIDEHFAGRWTAVPGPGTVNYRPLQYAHAPTLSITIGGGEAISTLSIWASRYDGPFNAMRHAALVWHAQHTLTKAVTGAHVRIPGFVSVRDHAVSTLHTS